MKAERALQFVLCVFSWSAAAGSGGLLNITAQPGENITLPCHTSRRKPYIAVEWSRPDLTSPVFFYKDEHLDEKHQHPSYVGRVNLMDKEMEKGNLSLIMNNVSSSDTGIYQCRVKEDEGKRRQRAVIDSEPVGTVNLTVTHPDLPPGKKSDGTTLGRFGGLGSLLVLPFICVFLHCLEM